MKYPSLLAERQPAFHTWEGLSAHLAVTILDIMCGSIQGILGTFLFRIFYLPDSYLDL